MKTNRNLLKAGVAATALVLAGAGGYVANAGAAPGGAVNAKPTAPVSAPFPSFADIVQRVAPAVVSIEVETKVGPRPIIAPFGGGGGGGGEDGGGLPPGFQQFFQGQRPTQPQTMKAAGSGFFISADGYIVTNNHVVENADKITIHTTDDRILIARVIGRDPATDLAVVKVEGSNLPFVSFEDRAKPRVGD